MWSKADFRAIPEIVENQQMPAGQGVRAFWLLPVGWMPIRSQSWRATNCATPGYENMAILKNYHIIIHESLANFKRILAANAWI